MLVKGEEIGVEMVMDNEEMEGLDQKHSLSYIPVHSGLTPTSSSPQGLHYSHFPAFAISVQGSATS